MKECKLGERWRRKSFGWSGEFVKQDDLSDFDNTKCFGGLGMDFEELFEGVHTLLPFIPSGTISRMSRRFSTYPGHRGTPAKTPDDFWRNLDEEVEI